MTKRLCLAAMVIALCVALVPSASAIECDGIPLDDGCLFTVTGGDTADPNDGFFVTNAYGVPLWDFVKDRDLGALGYPISQRWVEGPFTLQAFQKVILQWDPGKRRMNYYNTLDVLANRYPDVELPFVPAHRVLEEDRGASFGTIVRNHLAILERNAAIKERFLSEPDWLNLYGLPISYEEREVDGNPQGVQMLRTQRTVFVVWNVPAAGTTVGRVNLQNVPDKVKQLGGVIIPDWVKHPASELDPELAAAIQALPWTSGEVSPLQQDVLLRLETIAGDSPDLLGRLMQDDELGAIVHSEPTPSAPRILAPLITVARLPWMQDEINVDEIDFANRIIRSAGKWPSYVEALLQKTWLAHDLNRNEARLIRALEYELIRLSPSTSSERQTARIDQIFTTILSMPLMERIDGLESSTLSILMERYAHRELLAPRLERAILSLESVADYLESNGGITDRHASLIVHTNLDRFPSDGLTHPPYSFIPARPEYLDIYLDPNYTHNFDITIEERTIAIPNSGDLHLILAKGDGFFDITMDTLEDSVRIVQRFMGTPFPLSGISVLAGDDRRTSIGNFMHLYTGNHRYRSDKEYKWVHKKSELIHEIAHVYWSSAPAWVVEGGAQFVQIATGYPPFSSLEDIGERCRYDKIIHSIFGRPEQGQCDYFLGASLFLDLQRSLDADVFGTAFGRFHGLIRDGFRVAYYGPMFESPHTCETLEADSRRALAYLRQAFVSEVDSESAVIAERVLARWFIL